MTNQAKESDEMDLRSLNRGYSHISHSDDKSETGWRRTDGHGLELAIIGNGADLETDTEDALLQDTKVS